LSTTPRTIPQPGDGDANPGCLEHLSILKVKAQN